MAVSKFHKQLSNHQWIHNSHWSNLDLARMKLSHAFGVLLILKISTHFTKNNGYFLIFYNNHKTKQQFHPQISTPAGPPYQHFGFTTYTNYHKNQNDMDKTAQESTKHRLPEPPTSFSEMDLHFKFQFQPVELYTQFLSISHHSCKSFPEVHSLVAMREWI